jgi:hypothetical protein
MTNANCLHRNKRGFFSSLGFSRSNLQSIRRINLVTYSAHIQAQAKSPRTAEEKRWIATQREAARQKAQDNTHTNSFVYTRFHWPSGGTNILLWGSFNSWEKGIPLHRFSPDREASVVLPLTPGCYEVSLGHGRLHGHDLRAL